MEYNFNGCVAPKVDLRDYTLAKGCRKLLPANYKLNTPKVKNQGNVSSCVAHVTSSILEYYTNFTETLSTNFIYGIQNKECGYDGFGMHLRDACSIVKKYGDMLEEYCPGNDEVPVSWEVAERAFENKDQLDKAYCFRIKSYVALKNNDDIKQAIYDYGPVLCSVKWYENYALDKNCKLTGSQDGNYGYHAILIYGWDDNENGFLCQNSWGTDWGDNGKFILPYYIGVVEAYGLVDEENDGRIIQPKRSIFRNILYKIANFFLNLFNQYDKSTI